MRPVRVASVSENGGQSISRQSAANAEDGQPIKAETAKAIADTLGKAYGREIKVMDIQGLNIL